MPSKNYLAKKRLDKYYKLAKDEGFKSRAAFKLLQINREFNFLGSCQCVLDLCAAPGGWTQVCLKSMPLSSLIIAVDIEKMSNIGGCRTIQGDIFTQKCKFDIKKSLNNIKCDVVLHDGSPNVTGTWSKDAYAQCELTLQSLKLATEFLKHGGIFVTKVFRSNDYNSLLWVIKQFFENVIAYKPMASRNTSAETYFICKNYLSPKKIDKRLFDPQFIFREIEDKKESISVMKLRKQKKIKRNRSGYDIDGGIVHTSTNIIDFLESSKPETILGEYNAFDFNDKDQTNQQILSHELTDNEIKILLSDLTLLGKSDFRKLLKWRKKMIKHISSLQQPTTNNSTTNEINESHTKTSEELEMEENEKIKLEIEEMYDNKKKEQKKKQRKIRQAKIKRARTMLMGGIKDDDVWDFSHEQIGLYKLNDFETTEGLTEFIKSNVEVSNVNPKEKGKKVTHVVEVFNDSDSELEMTSKRLDDLYNSYKKRRNIKTKEDKKLEKKKLEKDAILSSDDEFSDINSNSDNDIDIPLNNTSNIETNININNTNEDNSMIVKPDEYIIKPEPKALIAKRWFGDDMFDNIEKNITNNTLINEMKEFLSSNDEDTINNDTKMKLNKDNSPKKGDINNINNKQSIEKFKESDLPDVLRLPYKLQRKMKKMNRDHRRRLKRDEIKRIERDCLFKEVPIVNVDKSINNDDMSTDSEGIAETLAIGEKMFKKKNRNEIIDGSYNKWCWNDNNDDLPKWFVDDENCNYKVNLPVTKEEVREYKEKLKAANARPIKKVAEAKARKKLRAQRAWNRIKRQATKIADNEDISEKSKIKQIQKLYKKMDKKSNKNDKIYMVSKGRKGNQGIRKAHNNKKIKISKNALKIRVDKRLKADKLGLKHREKRAKKGKKIRPRRTMNRHNLRKKSRKS